MHVATRCGDSTPLEYSEPPVAFTTLSASCTLAAPGNLRAQLVTETSVKLKWRPVPGAQSYQVQFKEQGARRWQPPLAADTNIYKVTGLERCKHYLFQAGAVCPGGQTTSWPAAALPVDMACIEPPGICGRVHHCMNDQHYFQIRQYQKRNYLGFYQHLIDVNWATATRQRGARVRWQECLVMQDGSFRDCGPYVFFHPLLDVLRQPEHQCGSDGVKHWDNIWEGVNVGYHLGYVGSPWQTGLILETSCDAGASFHEVERRVLYQSNSTVTTAATSATVTWDDVAGGTPYVVDYGPRGGGDEQERVLVEPGVGSLTLDELSPGLLYDFRVTAEAEGATAQTAGDAFVAAAPESCAPPAEVYSGAVEPGGGGVLVWEPGAGAREYRLEYRAVDEAAWTAQDGPQRAASTAPLRAGTTYAARVSSRCEGDLTSEPSLTSFFTVGGAPASGYCGASARDARQEWIQSLTIGGVELASGPNRGYADRLATVIPLTRGDAYAIAAQPGFGGETFPEHWTAWIDYDHDGAFVDGERILGPIASSSAVEAAFAVPAWAALGPTRLRIAIAFAGAAGPCGDVGAGEVEDYTVDIVPPAANPVPVIGSIGPASVAAGSGDFALTVTGSGFVGASVVKVNGAARTTTFASATQLQAAVPASDVAAAGPVDVRVLNPAPGGGASNIATLTVTGNPLPSIGSLSPSSATAGSPGFTLTVTGSGFVGASVVKVNGAARTTTFASATQLQAAVPASDVAAAGPVDVRVVSPAPGGGASNIATLTVTGPPPNPAPVIGGLAPATIGAGCGDFLLTVDGSGFIATSTVRINGADRPTTYVSPTRLEAVVSALDVQQIGSTDMRVRNPAPGGGPSNVAALAVTAPPAGDNPPPTLGSVVPMTVVAGGSERMSTVRGTGFVCTSAGRVNGEARATIYVSPTELRVKLRAGDTAVPGTVGIKVRNLPPGGGTSNVMEVTVTP